MPFKIQTSLRSIPHLECIGKQPIGSFYYYRNMFIVPTGLQAPPVSVTGHNLTSAREISAILFPDAKAPDPKWTLALMQYGQIITHDMSLAAGTTQGSE
jgi:hypothetical protein